jgi:ribonuclease T2
MVCWVAPAQAMEPLQGWFVAERACAAFVSKNKRTNPGAVSLEPRKAYVMRGTNAPARDWVQVTVPTAPSETARWVPRNCGRHVPERPGATKAAPQALHTPSGPREATDLLLALTWQPAFCESRPGTRECQALNRGDLPHAATRLSVHGLWPQPRSNVYCGVSAEIVAMDKRGRWDRLPAPQLDRDTRARLALAMPGRESHLDRHEWIKHGTCYFGDRQGDEYYDDTLMLWEAINASAVGALLAHNIGGEVRRDSLRAAFDTSFGDGAGARVEMICRDDQNRRLIQEIRIALRGEITEDADVGALIRAAAPQRGGCRAGIIDPAGLQ